MRLKFAGLALLASVSGAVAADMPRAAPVAYAKAPVAAGYNWTGFYIGAMGGYGWSQNVTIAGITGTSNDIKGAFGGGTVGYNWQAPGSQFVFGIEADGAWSDIKYSETALGITIEDRVRAFGSITGRVGFAADNALFYFKGGYAFADNRFSIAAAPFGALAAESHVLSGYTVGGGIEYGFTPNWSIKGEYMYSGYGSESYFSGIVPGGLKFGLDVQTVKFGVNYRFGGPVVARY